MKRALIAGTTGQDGSYLSELLLAKDYEVHGIIRRVSTLNTQRIDHLCRDPQDPEARFFLHYGDITDGTGLRRIVETTAPDEIYNLAAQSHVQVSFEKPEYTADVVATGALRLLEAVRNYMAVSGKNVRFYQAGSSEMFGISPPPQDEQTPFHPQNPYGDAKVAAYWYARNYREAYGMFVCNGIAFNHESPRRGETFVTRKITRAAGRIKFGLQDRLYLGNLNAKRDWGFAGDYVRAMWLMLQRPEPDDYVIATGTCHSVREFLEIVFGYLGLDWRKYVVIDPRYFRPAEIDQLWGDASKAREKLDWHPEVMFHELVRMMVEHDLELARQERALAEVKQLPALRGAGGGFFDERSG